MERKQLSNLSDNQSISGTRAGNIIPKPVTRTEAGIKKLEATLARVSARRDQLADPYYMHTL